MTDHPPRFSLIIATRGRVAELAHNLDTIGRQELADYEVIVVDQNDDDRLGPVLESCPRKELVRRVRCAPGVSRARNLGIELARGEILAFPDDDSWYPPHTLENVSAWFDQNAGYDLLSLTSRDANGEPSGNRWSQESCDLGSVNIFRTSVCYCFFVRSTEVSRTVRFDERIGPGAGTPIKASEDTDYVLTALQKGLKGRFLKQWHVGHPRKDVRNASIEADRAVDYGLGMGYVQHKHKQYLLWGFFVAYDMGRAMATKILGRKATAELYYAHGRGLLKAFSQR